MDINSQVGKENLKLFSEISLAAGLVSIVLSVVVWISKKDQDRSHAERLGIFIGLWVPSLLILSNRLSRLADE